jgi:hypothetical protein
VSDNIVNGVLVAFPSQQVFSNKENSIVLKFKETNSRNLQVKFYDETGKLVLEIKKVQEDFLVIEKIYFKHYGWFYFEVYEDGDLIEKSKFQVVKDGKKL